MSTIFDLSILQKLQRSEILVEKNVPQPCGAIRKLLRDWMISAPHSKGRLRIVDFDRIGKWKTEKGDRKTE